MNINIIAVGNIKENFLKDAIAEYTKRLSRYIKVSIIEVKDEKTIEGASDKQIEKILDIEGDRILDAIKGESYKIALAIEGMEMSSERWAKAISTWEVSGKGSITFIIGGSLGLASKVLDKCMEKISFSKMTFPHQLMRVILLEQIYRAYKINRHEPYHK